MKKAKSLPIFLLCFYTRRDLPPASPSCVEVKIKKAKSLPIFLLCFFNRVQTSFDPLFKAQKASLSRCLFHLLVPGTGLEPVRL